MDPFLSVFGVPVQDIRRTVVLMPFIQPRALDLLGIRKLSSGALYSSASTACLSVIRTGMGAAFTGDAVLHLAGSAAQNILFLGTCGLLDKTSGISVGDLVIPRTACNMESFSDILLERSCEPVFADCDPQLANDVQCLAHLPTPAVRCISFGSLYLEQLNRPRLQALGAQVIDMECAALFNAAKKTGHRALALLSVTDIPGEKPYYARMPATNKKSLTDRLSQACLAIKIISEHYCRPN